VEARCAGKWNTGMVFAFHKTRGWGMRLTRLPAAEVPGPEGSVSEGVRSQGALRLVPGWLMAGRRVRDSESRGSGAGGLRWAADLGDERVAGGF
jgi:hypothetical protein